MAEFVEEILDESNSLYQVLAQHDVLSNIWINDISQHVYSVEGFDSVNDDVEVRLIPNLKQLFWVP